jgi:hypothetical protein
MRDGLLIEQLISNCGLFSWHLPCELVRFAQFVARVHLLLENSQIIPNHDDFVEECPEPATAGKLISAEANCRPAA